MQRHLIAAGLFLLTGIAATGSAYGQRVIDITNSDVDAANLERMRLLSGGTIFPPDKYVKVKEGTPYYFDNWANGSLVLDGGATFQNLELKLDLLNHEIHYKDAEGREMIVTSKVREIILRPGGLDARYFVPGEPWTAVDKKLADSWLQVLVNDKTSLLLDIRKKVTESTPYNASTTEQTIDESHVYFLQKGGKMTRITRWRELLDLLGDRQKDVARYVKDNDLTGEAPVEWADLVTWYNKL